jgi:site-specific recombinase XerD
MATIKVILRNKPNKEAKLPLIIKIRKDRKPSIITLGHYLHPNDWDEDKQRVRKSHPNQKALNTFILKKLTEANAKLLELETHKSHVTAKGIRNSIKTKSKDTFFGQAEVYVENLRQRNKYNRLSADKPRVARFKEFLNGDDIAFSDITVPLLQRFQAYLKGTRKISERTVMNHLVVIRTIINQAIKDNIIDSKYYPFGKGKIQIKFPDSKKESLSIEEVKMLEDIEHMVEPQLHHARNLWLLSFYFAGMRISDLLRLKWSDFADGRLYYAMAKNSKGGSLVVPDKARNILNKYEPQKDSTGYVFSHLKSVYDGSNLFEVQKKISNATKTIDEALTKIAKILGIQKKLTMHIARHTFGNLSGDKIPIQMLQKLYRHSSIITTIGYQSNFINKDADDALQSVINFTNN